MSLVTFLLLSVVMAVSVGVLAALLLRAWLKSPRHAASAAASLRDGGWPKSRDGKEAL